MTFNLASTGIGLSEPGTVISTFPAVSPGLSVDGSFAHLKVVPFGYFSLSATLFFGSGV